MKNLDKINHFLNAQQNFRGITFGDENYHYARQISNSRFGHMPAGIAYCANAADVQLCVNFCRDNDIPLRIRSGGHQHEGMCSANDVLIIDLSEMYGAKIHDNNGDPIDHTATHAWIPVGMKLEIVYKALGAKSLLKTIPGGGCQSVNVGGLTQGGGWGTSIRKFGFTCDNVEEVEIVLSDGSIINTSGAEMDPTKKKDILWAIRGGGGGNFGVITRFKFRLSDLGRYNTTFGIRWNKTEDAPEAIKKWINFQKDLTNDLSCTGGLFKEEKGVFSRCGGKFYGTKKDLISILYEGFGELAPIKKVGNELIPITDSSEHIYFTRISEIDHKLEGENIFGALLADDQWFADFMSMSISIEDLLTPISDNLPAVNFSMENNSQNVRKNYTVLPNAPGSTCDRPHPHKVTSAFPKDETDHGKLVKDIYIKMKGNDKDYCPDVRKYMIWHCLGGASDNADFQEKSAFAFRNKPYLLQLQCWWDNSGDLVNDEGRATEYLNWMNEFRESTLTKETAGAFINFVDKLLVADISTMDNRLKLLTYYYGDNLDELRRIKTNLDKPDLFKFKMSIPINN